MSNSKRPSRPSAASAGTGSARKTSRSSQVAIVLIMVFCVAAVVGIPQLLSKDDKTTGSGPLVANPSPASVGDVTCETAPPAITNPLQTDAPPDPSLAEGSTWEATLHTSCGDIRLELDGKAAPQTVASFIGLARSGYWRDSPCHRLTTAATGIFVLQCGDPTGTGGGSPGYGFGIENAPSDGQYPRGTLAMARGQDPNSNGGQFFLVYKDTQLPTGGGGYTIFGNVTAGMQIIDAIAAEGVEDKQSDGAPFQPISILSVDVEKTG